MCDVLLVETQNVDRYRHHRAEYFPFLMGLISELGWRGRWLVVPIPPEETRAGARFIVGLSPDVKALLAHELEANPPGIIVFNDQPSEELCRYLLEFVPGAKVVDLTGRTNPLVPVGDILALLGYEAASDVDHDRLLVDQRHISFERRFIGGADPGVQPIRLASVSTCAYRRTLTKNRFYKDLESPIVREHRGCSFCNSGQRLHRQSADTAIGRALRQIEAHQAAVGDANARYEYHFEEVALHTHLHRFLTTVMERGVFPSTFVTMPRVDQINALKDSLDALLMKMRDAGHRLNLVSIGGENFSSAENERFNKGVTTDQIWACYETLQKLEATYPDTFECVDHGYFAAILFTPWTRPEDLRENLRAARKLGPKWLNRVLGTRLQLFGETPIRELARHDGLTGEDDDCIREVLAVCMNDPDDHEVPWRFADRRTARIHGILVRLEPVPEQVVLEDDDEQFLKIRSLRAKLPAALAVEPVELSMAIVDAVEQLGERATTEEIFKYVGYYGSVR